MNRTAYIVGVIINFISALVLKVFDMMGVLNGGIFSIFQRTGSGDMKIVFCIIATIFFICTTLGLPIMGLIQIYEQVMKNWVQAIKRLFKEQVWNVEEIYKDEVYSNKELLAIAIYNLIIIPILIAIVAPTLFIIVGTAIVALIISAFLFS